MILPTADYVDHLPKTPDRNTMPSSLDPADCTACPQRNHAGLGGSIEGTRRTLF